MDVQGKRREILAFAEKVVDKSCFLSKESFDHISTVWGEYNRIIEERGIKNGVVEKSIEIIEEEYERRLREGAFIENMRGISK
jgi:transcription initiation factor TFIIIB Brf1 subunit/transcription initiation factor TFIIB